jgi:transcriptional regulator with XRE-family HTH domain
MTHRRLATRPRPTAKGCKVRRLRQTQRERTPVFLGKPCATEASFLGARMITRKKPDAIDVEVGQRIRIQRLQCGLSQTALAKRIGVTFQQVQRYEKGVNQLGPGQLTTIAKVLGVPVTTFFGAHDLETLQGSDYGTASSALELLTVPDAPRLLRAYSQLNSDKMRQFIVDLVENIAADRRSIAHR